MTLPLLAKVAKAGLTLGKAGALAGAKWGIKKLAKRFRKRRRRRTRQKTMQRFHRHKPFYKPFYEPQTTKNVKIFYNMPMPIKSTPSVNWF